MSKLVIDRTLLKKLSERTKKKRRYGYQSFPMANPPIPLQQLPDKRHIPRR